MKVTDFICTPLMSLAQSKARAFIIFSCLGAVLKPHFIRCSHFKVDDVRSLEPSSKPPVRIVEDNVTASLHQQHTRYGLDAVTTQRGFASAGGHKHSAGLNTVWL
jgi:hypothetical protein